MDTATLSPGRDFFFPLAATTLTAGVAAALVGLVPTDLLATPPMPAMVCAALFGSFAAIALVQRPRPAAAPTIVVKHGRETTIVQSTQPPVVVPAPVKKAA